MNQRAQFISTTKQLMSEDDKTVLLLGDISVFAFRECFDLWPTRCYNIGVLECGMVGVAAGLAKSGFYPIVHTIALFLVRRAYEFILIDFGFQELRGCFVGTGHGSEYRNLGKTHGVHGVHELLATIPDMKIYTPHSGGQVASSLIDSVSARELSYIGIGG